jgi:hypothetical protein
MDNITNVRLGALPSDSPYMKPFRLHFSQNGREKNWGEIKIFFGTIDFLNSNYAIMQT